ncbi:MAG: carbohydrate ABC transporter permease [bacterium]|nr:carbohydrate ABC transporter permease [bacterium]
MNQILPDKLQMVKGRTLISEADYKKPSVKLGYWLLFIFLFILSITAVFPLLWGWLSGFKTDAELLAVPPNFLPKSWRFDNYIEAWNQIKFIHYFHNTLLLALGCWLTSLMISSLAAYSLSKLDPPAGKYILLLFLSTLMVPFTSILIPLYITVKDIPIFHINLLDTYWSIILPAGVNAFFIFLLKGFFDSLPNDLIAAARIDGASEFRIFVQLVLPLSKPVLAVLTIFSFMGTWNSFLWPLMVLSTPEKFPIMVKLYDFQLTSSVPWRVILSSLFIASTPPILLFMFFQKHIMRGITLTGLKG